MKGSDMKRFLRAGGALALLALTVPGMSAAASLHDGVVIDAEAAYVMSPKGGIDAIDLATGKVMWKSAEAAKPLLVKDGTLVAQARPGKAGELVVVALDKRAGAARGRVDVAIPEDIRANVFDGPSRKFRAQALETADGVVVSWSADEGPARGALPRAMPSEADVAISGLSGAVRVDLAAGRAVPVDKAQASISIRTSGTGRELASIDGRHLLRSERTGSTLGNRYRWTVIDVSGAKIASIEAPVSMAHFVVSGNRLLYVAQPSARRVGSQLVQEPMRLRAMDLGSGVELWSAPITDSEYRGPFPP